jgi:hypothetical protein
VDVESRRLPGRARARHPVGAEPAANPSAASRRSSPAAGRQPAGLPLATLDGVRSFTALKRRRYTL